jgi:hypothetical protein
VSVWAGNGERRLASRSNQAHAHHRQSVAIEIAGVANGNADDFAIVNRAAERLPSRRDVKSTRGQRRIERV